MRSWCVLGLVALGLVACGGSGVEAVDTGARPESPTETVAEDTAEETWPLDWADMEDEVLRLTNVQRSVQQRCGGEAVAARQDLSFNAELREAARAHSENMAAQQVLSHQLDGAGPGDRAVDAGYPTTQVGENIAAGQATPQEVVQGWMNSPGHCANIMGGGYASLGVGLYVDEAGIHWWTQVFGTVR